MSDKKRNFGGPVESGQMILVGEKGPEMFVTNRDGRIFEWPKEDDE